MELPRSTLRRWRERCAKAFAKGALTASGHKFRRFDGTQSAAMSGDLRIFIGTFNLGNAGPDLAFAQDFVALAEGYDLVVIGYVNAERASALRRTVAF